MKIEGTLLDKERVPTLEEMKAYFREHDFTTMQPLSDLSEFDEHQKELVKKAEELFEREWLQHMTKMGGKASFIDFSDDYPIRCLEVADKRLVSHTVAQLFENKELYTCAIVSFINSMRRRIVAELEAYAASMGKQSEDLTEEDVLVAVDNIANAVLKRWVLKMMQVQSVPKLLQTAKSNKTHEDFDNNVVGNNSKRDFLRRWTHSDTKAGTSLSLDEYDMEGDYLGKPDESNLIVTEFLATLNDTDRTITQLRMDGADLQEIADRVGYKTHSAVSKRLKCIARKLEEFLK